MAPDDSIGVLARITAIFEAVGDDTLMTVAQTGFPSEEMRDFFTTYAWVGAFDRIAAYLEMTSARA